MPALPPKMELSATATSLEAAAPFCERNHTGGGFAPTRHQLSDRVELLSAIRASRPKEQERGRIRLSAKSQGDPEGPDALA